ncbi:MAG: hypothetical protein PHH83_02410 [Patescibacteria group bacterium]|nr:hypothetical protein [Patescibacteria group bacterium]
MENKFEQEQPIFEVVKADDNLRTENCIIINIPEKTGFLDIIDLAQKNKATIDGDEGLYAIQFPNEAPRLCSEQEIQSYFSDLEDKYNTAA